MKNKSIIKEAFDKLTKEEGFVPKSEQDVVCLLYKFIYDELKKTNSKLKKTNSKKKVYANLRLGGLKGKKNKKNKMRFIDIVIVDTESDKTKAKGVSEIVSEIAEVKCILETHSAQQKSRQREGVKKDLKKIFGNNKIITNYLKNRRARPIPKSNRFMLIYISKSLLKNERDKIQKIIKKFKYYKKNIIINNLES